MPDLNTVGGVVSIDASAADGIFRLETTQNITSWSVAAAPDERSIMLAITNNGHTIAWTGLGTFLNVPPIVPVGDTAYIPMVNDQGTWVVNFPSHVPNTYGALQVLPGVNGQVTIDAFRGYLTELQLNGNLNSIDVTNMAERVDMSIFLVQDATGGREVDFAGMSLKGNAFDVNLEPNAIHEILVTTRSGAMYYQDAGSVIPAGGQSRLSAVFVSGDTI